jgi:hypothetical protein
MSLNKVCLDVQNSGQCMKGKDCPVCNPSDEIKINVDAKVYIPKSKQKQDENKLNFNLNAKEFVPKPQSENPEEDIEDEDEDMEEEELDMIMKDIIDNDVIEELGAEDDEDESDDEKWFPKYRDCECCKGFAYKCKGEACVNMGTCYCKIKDDCDDEDEDM